MNAKRKGSVRTSSRDEAPEITDSWFHEADLRRGSKPIRAGVGHHEEATVPSSRTTFALQSVLVLAGLLADCAYAQSPTEQVGKLESEWETSSDVSAYQRLLADDFIGQCADGSVTNREEESRCTLSNLEA